MVDTENSSSSLGDGRGTGNTSEEQPDEQQLVTNQRKSRPPRRPRTSTKWPDDKIVVTEIDMSGMPTKRKEQNRLRRLSGLIARQRLSLVMPNFNSLKSDQKWKLFDLWVAPHLEFPPEMKELGFRQVMKHIAKSWRTHKSDLVRNYLSKGVQPFRKHPYIEQEDWDEFVQLKTTEESKEESSKYKGLRERSSHEHSLGTAGYDRKFSQREKEDLEMSAQGIPNPWDQYPEGRPRNWLRARSRIEMSGGSARIVWNKSATEKMSEKIKDMHEQAEASSVTWVRENDLLSACLGPEQPGRVRAFSSYMGRKHGWPECSNMYRKRRRNNEVDVDAITARVTQEVTAKVTKEVTKEVTHNVTKEVSALLASIGLLQLPAVLTQPSSPAHGKRPSSCASASDVGGHIKDLHAAGEEQPIAGGHNGSEEPDPIAGLTQPTQCAFQISLGGYLIEVARGRVFPNQTVLHTVQVPKDHLVVQVEFVHSNFTDHVLPIPHNDDEITTLGQALLQRIQWKRAHVIVKETPLNGSSGPVKNSIGGSNSSPNIGTALKKGESKASIPDEASGGSNAAAKASQGNLSAINAPVAARKKAKTAKTTPLSQAKTAPLPHSSENQKYSKGSKTVAAASEAKKDA